MEGKVRAQNVVPEQAQLLIPGDGNTQALDCQRILRADVDVALVAAGGERGDHHALDDRMGVALHDGAVHERAGVALVAVADHILLALGLAADAVPLSARGKARAAAAGIEDLTADVLVGHLKERLFESGVAVVGKVFVNVLGVRRAAVFQHHALLLGVKGDLVVLGVPHAIELIEQALDRLAAEDGPFNDLVAVLKPDVRVKEALRLNLKQRPHFAEALFEVDGVVSALAAQRDARFQPALFTLGLQVVVDLQRAARNAARARADKDLAPVRREQLLGLYAQSAEPFSRQFSHLQRPPLHECPQAAQALFRDPSSRVPRRRSS